MSRRRTGPADEGFTLVETIVALGIVGAVMAGLAVFFIRSESLRHRQADMQVATQIAISSMDLVSELPAGNVLLGRTQAAVQSQWRAPGVGAYLDPARTELSWQDPSLPSSSTLPGLPTTPETIRMSAGATPFQRWWYVGTCWQPRTGGDCVVVPVAQRSLYVRLYRIVVAITWSAPDCAGNLCSHLATMLTESTLEDPTWE